MSRINWEFAIDKMSRPIKESDILSDAVECCQTLMEPVLTLCRGPDKTSPLGFCISQELDSPFDGPSRGGNFYLGDHVFAETHGSDN